MALVLFDRVKETSNTAGTGTIVLAGAVTGYQSFAVVGNTNTTYYTIADQSGPNWEVGIGTYYSGNVSLARTTILASSNANAVVNFTSATHDVFVTYPAEKSVNRDASSNVTGYNINGGSINGTAIGNTNPGDGTFGILTADGAVIHNAVTSNTAVIGANATIGGATNPIVAQTGAANNYIQAYIYNSGNGAYTSADFVAYPINGSDTAGWVDVGITGPVYNQAAYSVTGANEGYVFMSAPTASGTSGNLVFATDSTGVINAMQFYTGGFAQSKANVAMTLSNAGTLTVKGSIKANSTGFIFPDGTTQTTAATAGALAAGNSAIVINNVNVTSNANIAAGQNGFSVGPITTANGVSVTIASGQRWVVI